MATVPTTWNPADKHASTTLSGGGLVAAQGGQGGVRTVFAASSGKYYCEFTASGTGYPYIGLCNATHDLGESPGNTAHSIAYGCQTGEIVASGTSAGSGSATTVLGLLIDADTRKLRFRVGGVDHGTEFSLAFSGDIFVIFGSFTSGGSVTANFGADAFAYAVPSGYSSGFGAYSPHETLRPDSVVAGVVDSPELLPYSHETLYPDSIRAGRIEQPSLIYAPVSATNLIALPDSVSAGVVGMPALVGMTVLEPQSIVCGLVGEASIAMTISPQPVVAGSIGEPAIGAVLEPGPVVCGLVDSPALGAVLHPDSFSVGTVPAPSIESMAFLLPDSVVAGAVGEPEFAVTLFPGSVIASNGVGRPSFSLGATC